MNRKSGTQKPKTKHEVTRVPMPREKTKTVQQKQRAKTPQNTGERGEKHRPRVTPKNNKRKRGAPSTRGGIIIFHILHADEHGESQGPTTRSRVNGME